MRRRRRSAVMDGDLDEDVFRCGLGILDEYVEVAVLIEDARIEQLVLRVATASRAIRADEVRVRVRGMGILVEVLHVRVRGRGVEIEVVLLHVLAVIALAVRQSEEPLLQDGVLPVPQRDAETEQLPVVGDSGEPVLSPTVGAGAGVIVTEIIPRITRFTVVLADRAPLTLAEIGSPFLPGGLLSREPPRGVHVRRP